jgi:nucleoside 2-deoxyribosyltransferase
MLPVPMKIYLASPLGFTPSTKCFLEDLKSDLRKRGYVVVDPWETGDALFKDFASKTSRMSPEEKTEELILLNRRIGEANHHAIKGVDTVVAVLDGPDVDSGTASEVGFAFALGKLIIGYRGDIRLTGENESTLVNLQVQYWIEESGGGRGRLVRTVPDIIATLSNV